MSAPLDTTRSINDVIAANPNALPILSAHGIDTCCGGHEPLDAAAHALGLDPAALLLDIAASGPTVIPTATESCRRCDCGCESIVAS
jgi:iron-sulfur cluster repair protein YtfE (RIC family)